MSYFRKVPHIDSLLKLFDKNDKWLVLINADPDAIGSAMALKRLMKGRVAECAIAKVNKITRPDNLALVRYTRLHMLDFSPLVLPKYHRFALVDSQPGHHPFFQDIPFSVVIDHHPLTTPPEAVEYLRVQPEYGATSTMLTEYLHQMGIRPGKLLATALQYGIKTDTANFQRNFSEVDLRCFHYLSKHASLPLVARIARSEMRKGWLEYFARACLSLQQAGSGNFVHIGHVESPDILVAIADFFMRIYEIRWVVVSGIFEEKLMLVFRGDGVSKDLGAFAARHFAEFGSAGGHRTMARAELPLENLPEEPELFVRKHLSGLSNGRANKQTANGS